MVTMRMLFCGARRAGCTEVVVARGTTVEHSVRGTHRLHAAVADGNLVDWDDVTDQELLQRVSFRALLHSLARCTSSCHLCQWCSVCLS